jgi:carbon monoxide dehydrogenase subunit G
VKISGAYTVPIEPDRVYAVLQDPAILAKAMPGCNGLERIAEDTYKMKMKLLMASMSGLFEGQVRIADCNPPESFKLIVEGKGKAGFMKGEGVLNVSHNGAGTEVRYDGEVHVGGTIASVGQRLIDVTARTMIKRFFENLTAEASSGNAASS